MDNDDSIKNSASNTASRNQLNHIMEIIKAAFPYLDSDSQQSVDLLIKTGELMDAFQSLKTRGSVTAFSLRKESIDVEALLTGIRNVCYDRERELIDTVLNIFKAKSLYETYSAFASMASQSVNTENSDGTSDGGGSPDMMEILEAMLTPEQKSTFDNLNMMFNAMQ